MAFMNQERKQTLSPAIKTVLKKYGLKGSVAVKTNPTLVVNIKSGKINFIENFNETLSKRPGENTPSKGYIQVNPYWYKEHFTGIAVEALSELITAMNIGNHDKSDIQTDYFNVGWCIHVNIGQWDKPYLTDF